MGLWFPPCHREPGLRRTPSPPRPLPFRPIPPASLWDPHSPWGRGKAGSTQQAGKSMTPAPGQSLPESSGHRCPSPLPGSTRDWEPLPIRLGAEARQGRDLLDTEGVRGRGRPGFLHGLLPSHRALVPSFLRRAVCRSPQSCLPAPPDARCLGQMRKLFRVYLEVDSGELAPLTEQML